MLQHNFGSHKADEGMPDVSLLLLCCALLQMAALVLPD
jgi:hypothetical protein